MNKTRRIISSCGFGVCLALAWVWLPGPTWSHPAIDTQIQDLTAKIDASPTDANLYLRRGELHRIHRDWPKAEADYKTSLKLDPQLTIADYCLGRLKLESGNPAEAQIYLDRYLKQRPTDPEALAARARVLNALGKYVEAAKDFTGAIDNARNDSPRPEYFLERARALEAAGPSHIAEALTGLDDGVERLGEVITLQLYAVELELARANYEGALERLDLIAARSVRQEPWLVRKATILEAAGREEDARAAYEQTLASINSLPSSRRSNRAVTRLEDEAREALKRLGTVKTPQ
jgi:tetratricopeptide (TPR) repeat protein